MPKAHLKLVTPGTVNRTVTPRRRPNGDLRTREYLTAAEIEKLMNAAQGNRHGHRDTTMILVAYRHGLRVSELVDLRWDQVDFRASGRACKGQAKAIACATASRLIRGAGSEVFPNENYLSSVPQPAARQEQFVR